eukprot:TRINITY_DN15486_c0_g1_i2.p1 TRINITY_DN15486_c0_g1~~TRINITY_DN15486_c0_g1_i2.p1  ORF type:complete len:146 (-),score=9.48 TRINITY_DN15486_c0_g1_i2:36-473(-)
MRAFDQYIEFRKFRGQMYGPPTWTTIDVTVFRVQYPDASISRNPSLVYQKCNSLIINIGEDFYNVKPSDPITKVERNTKFEIVPWIRALTPVETKDGLQLAELTYERKDRRLTFIASGQSYTAYVLFDRIYICLLYTSPSPRDQA